MEAYFKYPDGPDLDTEEILRLLELFRSCLLGKRAVQGVVKRAKDNIHEFQRDTYQLGILTLNLGHINRVPYIGGCSKFPKWVRTDINHRALPHIVFRNAAHIVCLCEASDEYGGIAVHREIAKEYGMIGMVVHPAIQSQSLAIFIRGDHDVGTFIELLGHHQIETGNKTSPFWILHGAIFRLCHGQNTSGEFVDPSTGVRIPKPDVEKNVESMVHQHCCRLATTLDFLDHSICEIDGDDDLAVSGVEVCEVNPGADTHTTYAVSCWPNAALRFFTSLHMPGVMPIRKHAGSGSALLPVVLSTNVIFCLVMATFLHSAVLSLMTIPISGRAS